MKKKELLIKAATGQGKSYETAMNTLFVCIRTGRPCIIATSSKLLVDQYLNYLINFYENFTVKGIRLKERRITILGHTKESLISDSELLAHITKGFCIIVTVHSYICNFDDYHTSSLFHGLVNIFLP